MPSRLYNYMLALEIDFKNVVLVTSNGQKISAFINRAKNLSNNHKCEKVFWGKAFKVSHTQSQPHHTRETEGQYPQR